MVWSDRPPSRPWRRARATIAFPTANIGRNLPTLAATLAGNLYDLGETTGVRLLKIELTTDFRDRFWRPLQGVAGTRRLTAVHDRPLMGTIIKPNVGLSPAETAALVGQLCESGVDFIKDDECCGDPEHAQQWNEEQRQLAGRLAPDGHDGRGLVRRHPLAHAHHHDVARGARDQIDQRIHQLLAELNVPVSN